MCKASARYYRTVAVSPNKSYHISNGGDVGKTVAVLHEATEGFNRRAKIKCAVCIKEPMDVTVLNVPEGVQRGYDLATSTLTGTFIPGPEDSDDIDVILMGNGNRVPLNDLIGEDTRLHLGIEKRSVVVRGAAAHETPVARAA